MYIESSGVMGVRSPNYWEGFDGIEKIITSSSCRSEENELRPVFQLKSDAVISGGGDRK